MADTNKVLFGFSELYIGTYEVDGEGTVTLGTPYHQRGAVGYSPEAQGDNYTFYADNIAYYSSYTGGSFEGDLVIAKADDEFKKQFLGYVETAQGGLAQVKNAKKPSIYIAFQIEGDVESEKIIFYNGSLGDITREYATIEESVEVQTETISTTFTGDNKTGITMVTYKPGDAGYDELFTNPPVPELAEEESE